MYSCWSANWERNYLNNANRGRSTFAMILQRQRDELRRGGHWTLLAKSEARLSVCLLQSAVAAAAAAIVPKNRHTRLSRRFNVDELQHFSQCWHSLIIRSVGFRPSPFASEYTGDLNIRSSYVWYVQGWAKEWPAARGSQEAGFTQPNDHSFCTVLFREWCISYSETQIMH